MSRSKEDWISQRAYALWEAEGRPEGRGGGHWAQAAEEYERLERTKASADGQDLIAKLRSADRLMRDRGAGEANPPEQEALQKVRASR